MGELAVFAEYPAGCPEVKLTRDEGVPLHGGARDYLGSMRDHGGNATPVWHIAGWMVFRSAPANELTLSLAELIGLMGLSGAITHRNGINAVRRWRAGREHPAPNGAGLLFDLRPGAVV